MTRQQARTMGNADSVIWGGEYGQRECMRLL